MAAESLLSRPAKNPSVGLHSLMPTILVIAGFAFRIFRPPREHGPPHVHVWKSGAKAIILLGDSDNTPTVRRVLRMSPHDVTRALRIVGEHQELLLRRWREYHE